MGGDAAAELPAAVVESPDVGAQDVRTQSADSKPHVAAATEASGDVAQETGAAIGTDSHVGDAVATDGGAGDVPPRAEEAVPAPETPAEPLEPNAREPLEPRDVAHAGELGGIEGTEPREPGKVEDTVVSGEGEVPEMPSEPRDRAEAEERAQGREHGAFLARDHRELEEAESRRRSRTRQWSQKDEERGAAAEEPNVHSKWVGGHFEAICASQQSAQERVPALGREPLAKDAHAPLAPALFELDAVPEAPMQPLDEATPSEKALVARDILHVAIVATGTSNHGFYGWDTLEKFVLKPWSQIKSWTTHLHICTDKPVKEKPQFEVKVETRWMDFPSDHQFIRRASCTRRALSFASDHGLSYEWVVRWQRHKMNVDWLRGRERGTAPRIQRLRIRHKDSRASNVLGADHSSRGRWFVVGGIICSPVW